MKITILIFLFVLSFNSCFSQLIEERKNTIGVSLPLIVNNSKGVFYSLGNRREPTGKAISYGLNITYTRKIYKNWFTSIGAGYFKQSFNITRPFNFGGDTLTNLLYSTKTYSYHCLTLFAGLGYGNWVSDNLKLNGIASIMWFSSFKQNYTPTGYSGFEHEKKQTNKMNMQIGYMLYVSPGVEYFVSKRVSIGADIAVPVITKWNNDKIFIESPWGNDSQKIAENRFSIGTTLSCKYIF